MMTIPFLTAHEMARRVRAGELTALEIAEAHLAHIEAVDGVPGTIGGPADAPGVHAFITVTADRARAQAKAVDAKIAGTAGEQK